MQNEGLCPNCNQTVESGATFCGNCGFKLIQTPVAQVYANGPAITGQTAPQAPVAATSGLPAYAIPQTHHKKHWAAMALVFGLFGIGAGILSPLLGLALGICGVILITSSFSSSHGAIKSLSLTFSLLAIAASLAFAVNNIAHDPRLSQPSSSSASATATVNVTTPCYSLSFNSELNVSNASGSCTMNAFNGRDFKDSSNVYKIIADQTTTVTSSNFDSLSKMAITKDVADNLTGYKITSQASNLFDGRPAYYIQAYNSSINASMIEETVLNEGSSSGKDNFFDIIHASTGQGTDLSLLEKSWQWND